MTYWPTLKNRLVALLPTLDGWAGTVVYNGPPVTAAVPTSYATVGFVVGEDFAGSAEQVTGIGDIDSEAGTIRSEIVCTTGAVDLPSMEAAAFALFDSWNAAVRADRTLGVLPKGSTCSLAVDVDPRQSGDGASQRLTVTLTYTARV